MRATSTKVVVTVLIVYRDCHLYHPFNIYVYSIEQLQDLSYWKEENKVTGNSGNKCLEISVFIENS